MVNSSMLPVLVLIAGVVAVVVVVSLLLVGVRFGKKKRIKDIKVAQALLTADNHMDHARNWLTKPSARAEEARLALEDLHDVVRQGIDDPRIWSFKRTIEQAIAEWKGVPLEQVMEEWDLPTQGGARRDEDDSPAPRPRRERPVRHVLSGRILIVDSDKDERVRLLKMLQDLFPDFEISTASDEEDVYKKVRDDKIDLVITEMHMPRIDGRTILAYLKRSHPTVEVIVASAVAPLHARELEDLRAYGVLGRPVLRPVLEGLVRHCAEQRFPYNEWRKSAAAAANG